MDLKPVILFGHVMHKRLFPAVNQFVYGIYYLGFPLSKKSELQDSWRFGFNKRGAMSFHERDHGARDGTQLSDWIQKILRDNQVTDCDGDVFIISLPRVFGYVFNPITCWFCHGQNGALRAVLCEVNNTFGEAHSYLCLPNVGDTITPDQSFIACQ